MPCASPSAPLTVSSCQVNISATIRMKEKQVIYSELIDLSELVYLLSCCRVDFRPVGWGESSWQMVSGSFSSGKMPGASLAAQDSEASAQPPYCLNL